MIIFGGWGSWAALFGGAGVAWIVGLVAGEGARGQGFALLLAGIAVAVFGQWLHDWDLSPTIDPETGQQALSRKRHHFFWIPVRWWGVILVVLGFFGLVGG